MVSRVWGAVMMTAAIAGFIITTFMLVQVWRLKQPVTDSARAGVNLMGMTLDTTSDALTTVQQSLDSTSTQVESLNQLSQTLAGSMHDTGPLLDSLKTLTGKDLPSTIRSTEKSLNSAQSSARLVDGVLSTLTRIPFLPVKPYTPDVSLESALGQMTTSLDGLNPSLASINQSLDTASGNMASMEAQTREMSRNIQGIKRNVSDLNGSVAQYRQTVSGLRVHVNELAAALPGLVTLLAVVLSFVLLWLMITQIDLLVRGLALVRSTRRYRRFKSAARSTQLGRLESEEV